MPEPKREPSWRTSGNKKPNARVAGWQSQANKDPASTGNWSRIFTIITLGGVGVGVLGGLVVLAMMLYRPARPALLVIAANPVEAVHRLDIPYDPYGWLTAQRLLSWTREADDTRYSPEPLQTIPAWLDDLDDWADKVGRDSRQDPVIIYVGLHGGVSRNGDPVLYPGRAEVNPDVKHPDGPTVALSTILDKLQSRAAAKRKILVLDVARGLPDSLQGEVYHDFVRAVNEKLKESISKKDNLAVILGAADGQRAWESPTYGMTNLGYHLAMALTGKACPEQLSAFTTADLFQYLHTHVDDWAKNKRPTPQTPLMLPDVSDWNADQKIQDNRRKFFKLEAAAQEALEQKVLRSASDAPNLELVNTRLQVAESLVGMQPSPTTYSPIAWRRYRELLLRHEQAMLAGDTAGLQKLEDRIKPIEERLRKGLDLQLDSTRYISTLGQAQQNPSPIQKALESVIATDTLEQATDRLRKAVGASPSTVESHLPLMLRHFNDEVVKAEPGRLFADTWYPAMSTRLLAERAVYAQTSAANGHHYCERIWPLVRDLVRKADESRRRGDDTMLADGIPVDMDLPRVPREEWNQATKLYREALEIAGKLQKPLQVRNRALADLPFIARWLSEFQGSKSSEPGKDPPDNQAFERLIEVSKDAHTLTALLDAVADGPLTTGEQIGSLTTKIDAGLNELRVLIDKNVEINTQAADVQSRLLSIEHLRLLPSPLISQGNRMTLLKRSLQIEETLHSGNTPLSSDTVATGEQVMRRTRSLAQEVSGEWRKAANPANTVPVADKVSAAPTGYPLSTTAEFAFLVARDRRDLSNYSSYPSGSLLDWQRAESISRQSVAAESLPDMEPAAENALARWRILLDAQANRIALDHWYDDKGQPFFTNTIAKTLIRDADQLSERLGDRRKDPTRSDKQEAERLIAVAPLKLDYASTNPIVRWTTELSRSFVYKFGEQGYKVPGHGIFWSRSDTPGILGTEITSRRSVVLDRPQKITSLVSWAGPRDNYTAERLQDVKIQAFGYFRGQRLLRDVPVRINRRPDQVVTQVQTDRKGLLALRAEKDFGIGAVAIVLDFSASMRDRPEKEKASKRELMLQTLEGLLNQDVFPRNAKLTIRAFHDKTPDTGVRIFPSDEFSSSDITVVLPQVMTKLRSISAEGNTPLLPTMEEALEKDFPQNAPDKTLLVITDGADTSKHSEVFGKSYVDLSQIEATDPRRKKLVESVQANLNKFDRRNTSIHMIVFSASDEKALAEEMYSGVSKFTPPGRLYLADTVRQLDEELVQALRPKPRLVESNGARVNSIPADGIPANRLIDGPARIWWRGPLEPRSYFLLYSNSRQSISFERGDNIMVRMERLAGGETQFRREIYFRDIRNVPDRKFENKEWFLSVPEYNYVNKNYFYLSMIPCLEEIATTYREELMQVKPDFVWWGLGRRGSNGFVRYNVPIHVTNHPGYFAPSWQITADDGKEGKLRFEEFELRCWAQIRPLLPMRLSEPLLVQPGELRDPAGAERKVADGLTVRMAIEPATPIPDPTRINADLKSGNYLVVRVDDTQNRTFQVRVPSLVPSCSQHRYFHDPEDGDLTRFLPKVVGTTVIFGPLTEEELNKPMKLEITNVTEALEPSMNPGLKPMIVPLGRPDAQGSPDLNMPKAIGS